MSRNMHTAHTSPIIQYDREQLLQHFFIMPMNNGEYPWLGLPVTSGGDKETRVTGWGPGRAEET